MGLSIGTGLPRGTMRNKTKNCCMQDKAHKGLVVLCVAPDGNRSAVI